ncbi:hypothetical protein AAC03nite_19630 [Alicyclobacillus acidoterrestris]|nr:hypothetical protein AAC03nite_19630 [Alicyclobacillus acidoterrestris]
MIVPTFSDNIPSYQIKTATEMQDVVKVDCTVDLGSLAHVMERFLSERNQTLWGVGVYTN